MEVTVRHPEVSRSLEAVLLVSDEPMPSGTIAQALEVDRRIVDEACEDLAVAYEDRGSGFVLQNVAGGWRLATHPETAGRDELVFPHQTWVSWCRAL